MIGAFKKNGIAKTVTESQVNAYGRVHIGKHSCYRGLYSNFFHFAANSIVELK
jgi:hypothetical protein